MKQCFKYCQVLALAFIAIISTGLILAAAAPAAAQAYQNFEKWQQNAFHGFTIPITMTNGDWAALESTGANLGRIFVSLNLTSAGDAFVAPVTLYDQMDAAVSRARRHNIRLVVTFNPKPIAPDQTYWASASQQDSIVAIIAGFAARYAGNDVFAGIDILNEPYPANVSPASVRDGTWNNFAARIIRAVRAQDPTRVIVYEWPRWNEGYSNLLTIPFEGIVYSTHWYSPLQLTHQHVMDKYPDTVPYPVSSDWSFGPFDKTSMTRILGLIRDFQVRYGKPIYIGEFSCARWAPGSSSYKWVSDAISIFDGFHWNWTYHHFRGVSFWDAERPHGQQTEARSLNTDTMRLLRQRLLSLNP